MKEIKFDEEKKKIYVECGCSNKMFFFDKERKNYDLKTIFKCYACSREYVYVEKDFYFFDTPPLNVVELKDYFVKYLKLCKDNKRRLRELIKSVKEVLFNNFIRKHHNDFYELLTEIKKILEKNKK